MALPAIFLLSKKSNAFLCGLFAFLASHALFAAAFLRSGVDTTATSFGAAAAVPAGVLILRWLWPHLAGKYRIPVVTCVSVIMAMCALAAGYAFSHGKYDLAERRVEFVNFAREFCVINLDIDLAVSGDVITLTFTQRFTPFTEGGIEFVEGVKRDDFATRLSTLQGHLAAKVAK